MTTIQKDDTIFPNGKAILIVGIVVIIMVLVGREYATWLKTSNSFRIQKVIVTGNELVSEKDIRQFIGFDSTKTVWEIDLPSSEKKIKENTFTERICVTRHFPDELHVTVEEKTPVALLNFKSKLYCMNSEGLILPSKPGKMYDLPVLSGPFEGGVNIGQEVTGDLIDGGLHLLRMVIDVSPNLYSNISEIVLGRNQGIVIYTNHSIPIWFGEHIIHQKVWNLEAILNQLKKNNEMKTVKYIDLRFRDQVVVGMRA